MTHTVAIFGGSFNPPGLHHQTIAQQVAEHVDEVLVVPCGPRPDKQSTNDIAPIYRATMADMAFRDLPRTHVELFDLEQATFTRTHELEARFADRGELWHVVGAELVAGGGQGQSVIHRKWADGPALWHQLRFLIVARDGYELPPEDLPPRHRLIHAQVNGGSSTRIRECLFHRQPFEHLVTPEVATFIHRYGLYRGRIPNHATRLSLDQPRLMIEADERNPKARAWAERLAPWVHDEPDMIAVIGGDGTMLRAIRKHWRLRLPFLGFNAGHLGFLLNQGEALLEAFPPGEVVLRRCPLIYAEVERADGTRGEALAFNDAWIERASGQTAWVEVTINGRVRLPKLICDGALLSTAAGSTAYAQAMGATPLLADTPAWLLVGSNVMNPRNWRSALIGEEAHVSLVNLHPEKRPLRAFVDGIDQGEVKRMDARISRIAAAELAFLSHHDMAEKIAQIQFPT